LRLFGATPRFQLVADALDLLGRRADENDAVVRAGGGELGALGKKSIARMHRLRTDATGSLYQRADAQVAVGCARRSDAHGTVGHSRGQAWAVGRRSGQYRVDAQSLQCANDPHRDLPTVGDQHATDGPVGGAEVDAADGLAHVGRTRMSTWSNSTSAPSLARISTTSPSTPAAIEFISFITSMMPTALSRPTRAPTETNGAAPGFGAP